MLSPIKVFTVVINYVAIWHVIAYPFHPNLIFPVKDRSLPFEGSPVRGSAQASSRKIWTRVEKDGLTNTVGYYTVPFMQVLHQWPML